MGLKRASWITATVVLWLGAAFLLLSAVFALLQATGGRHRTGTAGIGAFVFLVILAAGLARLGLATEHRAREVRASGWSGLRVETDAFGHPLSSPGPPDPAVMGPGPASGAGPVIRGARTRRRRGASHHPVSQFFGIILLVFLIVGPPAYTIGTYLSYARSQLTQHHGIHDTAIALRVINTEHCGRGGCYYTAAAPARLIRPIDGHLTTTIHSAGRLDGHAGSFANVLVDPHDPGYAELPGDPLVGLTDLLLPVGAWVVLWGVMLVGLRQDRRRRRSGAGPPRRRRQRRRLRPSGGT